MNSLKGQNLRMPVTIESLAVTDFEQIAEIVNCLVGELFGNDKKFTPERLSKIKDQWSQGENHWAFCARMDGKIVGLINLGESFGFFAYGRYGVINELWVDPKQRNQKIGQRLIQEAAKFGKSRRWERMDVTSPPGDQWQQSFDFYVKNGFSWTGKKLKVFIK